MTIHLSRDFQTLGTTASPSTNLYLFSIFLNSVLGFQTVGQSSFDLEDYTVVSGKLASINTLGPAFKYYVSVPTSSYVVSSFDNDRILALKSLINPKHNSGIFRITSVYPAANSFVIDYMTLEEPPSESETLEFAVFKDESDATNSFLSGSNNFINKYNTYSGSSNATRTVLQSPDKSNWQIRLALETLTDLQGINVPCTIAPGYFGNDFGDFEIYENKNVHLHGAMFHNTSSLKYRGLTVGAGTSNLFSHQIEQFNISFIGDDSTGTFGYTVRSGSVSNVSWGCVGIPTDELLGTEQINQLTDEENISRLFAIGSSDQNPGCFWDFDYANSSKMNGVAWGTSTAEPVSCIASTYFPGHGDTATIFEGNTNLEFQLNTTDDIWTGTTCLLDADLLVGTLDSCENQFSEKLYEHQPRIIGKLPFFMQGRANYGDFHFGSSSVTSSWLHINNGVYMQWDGPILIDNLTGSNITILNSPGENQDDEYILLSPDISEVISPEEIIKPETNKDANRYTKTYSFFRQPPRLVDIIKGGSNTSK